MKALLTNNVSVDFIKGALDGLNNMVVAIDKVISKLGTFGTLGAIGGIATFIKQMSNFSNLPTSLFSGGLLGNLKDIFALTKQGFQLDGFSGGIKSLGVGFSELASKTGIAKVAVAAFKSVLAGIGWGLLIAGISWAIQKWDEYAHATENAVQAAQEAQQEARNEISSLNSQKTSLSQIADEYDQLSRKTSLTADEHERLRELRQQIAEQAPDLVAGYDANGDPILKLSGSLQDYISELDVAIAKQQQLIREKQAEEAQAYLKENSKNKGKEYDNLIKDVNSAINGTSSSLSVGGLSKDLTQARDFWGNYATSCNKSTKEVAEIRKKWREKEKAEEQKLLEQLSEERKYFNQKDIAVQSSYINDFIDNMGNALGTANTGKFTGFMEDLGWGSLEPEEADRFASGMQRLATQTAFAKNEMVGYTQQTDKAYQQFKNTGAINAYGKELQKIAKDSRQFDMQSWSEYLNEVNARFEEGALNADQYEYSLGIMAQTMSDLCGVPYDIVLESLMSTGDVEQALKSATSGLNEFLSAYGKTATDLRNGDSLAIELQKQFEAISDLGVELEERSIQGTFTAEWVLEESKNNENLPAQMRKMMELVASSETDEVTEVEKRLLMNVQAEIQEKGKIQDDTLKEIEQLLDDDFVIDKEFEIAGLTLSKEQAEALRKELQETGITAEEIEIADTGLEEQIQLSEQLNEKLNEISNVDLRLAFKQQSGILNTVEEIDVMMEAISRFKDTDTKVEFIAETAQFFEGANSVEEGIKKIPDHLKIKYNVGIEGDERLTELNTKVKSLPEEVRSMIYAETYNLESVDTLISLVKTFGETKATAILKLDGVSEVIQNATSAKDMLIGIQEIVKNDTTLTVEVKDEMLKLLEQEIEKLQSEDNKVEVEVDANTEPAKQKNEEVKEQKEELKEDVEYNVTQNNTNVEEKSEEVKQEKKEVEKPVETKITADGSQAKQEAGEVQKEKEKTKEPVESKVTLDGSQAKQEASTLITEKGELGKPVNTLMTIMVDGRETIQAAINEKGQLEVNGQSKTHVYVEGLGQYSIAINDKGQLEVNGVAQTHVQIKDGEQLKITKNDKGQLEVNGQAVTDVKINGAEKVKETKEAIEQIPDKKESSVSIKFDVNDAIDDILSRLGLSKKKETIEITVKAIDEASSTLDKINGYNDKTVTFTVKCSGASEALSQVQSLSTTPISNKQFSIICNGGTQVSAQIGNIASRTIPNKTFSVTANTATVSSQLNAIATRTIPNKTFQITCNDSASAKISAVAGRQIPTKTFSVICNDQATSKLSAIQNKRVQDKKFTINCTDQASAKISKVQAKKINNKSFTVSCTDNASTKLSSIISKLSSITSKSITVTTTYKQVGTPPNSGGTGPSANPPQVLTQGTAIPLTIDDGSIASTMSMARTTASAVNEVMASTKAKGYTDTILASKYWANQNLDHDLDLLKDYTAQLDKVASKLDVVGAKIDGAFGTEKAGLLKDQIKLLEQQQAMLKKQQSDAQILANSYKSLLQKQGFKVDSNGAVTNSTSKILELEHALEKAQKAQDAYTGDNEKKQKSLQKAVDNAQQKLSKAEKTLDEYYEMSKKVGETEAEWREIANAIADAKNEIYEANKEQANFYYEANVAHLGYEYDALSDKLDIIQTKMDLTDSDEKKIELLNQQLEIMEQQRLKNLEMEQSYKNQQEYYKNYLKGKGFEFDSEGNITNGDIALDQNKSSDELESIKDAYDSYMELQRDTIPDLEKDWYELLQAEKETEEEIKAIEEEMKRLEEEAKELEKIKFMDNIDQATRKAEQLNAEMEKLNDEMEMADGEANKVDYMNKQIDLLGQQMTQQQEITKELQNQEKYLQNTLGQEGFKFDSNGDISNLEDMLNSAQTQEEYDKIKEKAEEYYDVQEQITESENQWRDYQLDIKETQKEIENMKYEMKEMKDEANLQEFTNNLDVVNNKMEKLQAIGELNGTNTLDNLNQQLDVIKEQQQATEDLLAYQLGEAKTMQNELAKYGFNFNADGTVENAADQLEHLKNTLSDDEFERVSETLESYFDVALSEIPDLENQLIEYQRDYQDILEQKLEATEKIEQEITKIIEKQIEDRVKEIEEERDAQVDSLNKQKEAYNKWRDEVDYEDDYNEQLEKVQELQAQLEIAKRDDSLGGQKRVEELMNELKEEQKALEDLVQDKIDEDVNNMIDDQIEHIEENADKQIEDLENTFTETKIAEMVAEAINTGVFTDIEGNVVSLETALMDFANNSVEYMGVMGESLKTELLDNLNVALETMTQLSEINKQLNSGEYNTATITPMINTSKTALTEMPTVQGGDNRVTLGDMVINVQGNVSKDSIGDIKIALEEQRVQIINEIMANVK